MHLVNMRPVASRWMQMDAPGQHEIDRIQVDALGQHETGRIQVDAGGCTWST